MDDRRQRAPYDQPTRPPPSPMLYPKITSNAAGPTINRTPAMKRPAPEVPSGPATHEGVAIRVALKSGYCVQEPARLSPIDGEVPRTTIQFDFDFERQVIAEADKGWTMVEAPRQANGGDTATPASQQHNDDPIVSKYVSMGHNKEAVVLALKSYGDVQNKVLEFCPAYNILREMGFPSEAVAEALVMYDNDKERALAHFV